MKFLTLKLQNLKQINHQLLQEIKVSKTALVKKVQNWAVKHNLQALIDTPSKLINRRLFEELFCSLCLYDAVIAPKNLIFSNKKSDILRVMKNIQLLIEQNENEAPHLVMSILMVCNYWKRLVQSS